MSTITIRRMVEAAVLVPGPVTSALPPAIFATLVRSFVSSADESYLQNRTPPVLIALVGNLLGAVMRRPNGHPVVRVFNPVSDVHGYQNDQTILEFCTLENPLVLQAVRIVLQNQKIREYACIPLVLEVERDAVGMLVSMRPVGKPGTEETRETVFHMELERLEAAGRKSLEEALLESIRAAESVTRHSEEVRTLLTRTVEELEGGPPSASEPERVPEGRALLRWLSDSHFLFMGYFGQEVSRSEGRHLLGSPTMRLGLAEVIQPSDEEIWRSRVFDFLDSGAEVAVYKGAHFPPVQHNGLLDVVLVRLPAGPKRPATVRVFIGTLSPQGERHLPSAVPLLRQRFERIFLPENQGTDPRRQDFLRSIFNALPNDLLLGLDARQTFDGVTRISAAIEKNATECIVALDNPQASGSVLLALPRSHFDDALQESLRDILQTTLRPSHGEFRHLTGPREYVFGLFFLGFRAPPSSDSLNGLESRLAHEARPWDVRFRHALIAHKGEAEGTALAKKYTEAADETYPLEVSPEEAVGDVEALEKLARTGTLQVRLRQSLDEQRAASWSLMLYSSKHLILANSFPVITNFGLNVLDQSARVFHLEDRVLYMDVFRVNLLPARSTVDLLALEGPLGDGIRAVMEGGAEDDSLNRLVLTAGLTWRQVAVLRAYLAYARQVDAIDLDWARRICLGRPIAISLLIEHFIHRFKPDYGLVSHADERIALLERSQIDFLQFLNGVDLAAEDRFLRLLLKGVISTVRTNFFCTPQREYISFKVDSRQIHPNRRGIEPRTEIFVYHPRMEGIHLRGGPLARGGIRWSDRLDDYRSEVLDLMRTQMVKNVVIVPVGAKGGFVVRYDHGNWEFIRKKADELYPTCIRGLLDVTDNVIDDRVVHPAGVVVWDGDDTYLVVAPDKGTAHLSDVANKVAEEYGYWLGDAFASGGSRGYDHKKEAITSRGVWECVKRQFREIGIAPESQPFTCVGIGDMSGDVFGNGMLLSRSMKLLGAFNHMHIFIDPDPDPGVSYQERSRLFGLPRSTWEDYNPSGISQGGGVFRRTAKAISLSLEAQKALGTDQKTVSGEELVRIILCAPVDLLWNGGIGTYVKAFAELHAAAGDKSNDAVRVDAIDLRARVVAEGGNLGFTQAARIEYAFINGRINTDALENSGGVAMSDFEVNIKILLESARRSGVLAGGERDAVLQSVKEEVAAGVVGQNYSQSLMISLDQIRSSRDVSTFAALIMDTREALDLDLSREKMPTESELIERAAIGVGLTRPELATLGALAKMRVKKWLMDERFFDGPIFDQVVTEYFPEGLRETYRDAILTHPLRRQICTTVLCNRIVDSAGMGFFQLMHDDTRRSAPEIALAWLVSSKWLGAGRLRQALCQLDGKVDASVQYAALIDLEDSVTSHCGRVLRRYPVLDSEVLRERMQADYTDLLLSITEVLPSRAVLDMASERDRYIREGIPESLARDLACLPKLVSGSDIARVREETGLEAPVAGWLYHGVGERIGVRAAYELAKQVEPRTRIERNALAVLCGRLIDFQYRVTVWVCRTEAGKQNPEARLEEFMAQRRGLADRVKDIEGRVQQNPPVTIASLTVLVAALADMVRSPS